MKRCKGCFAETKLDELDLDSYCFTCASGWPTAAEMQENIRQAMNETAKALIERDLDICGRPGSN